MFPFFAQRQQHLQLLSFCFHSRRTTTETTRVNNSQKSSSHLQHHWTNLTGINRNTKKMDFCSIIRQREGQKVPLLCAVALRRRRLDIKIPKTYNIRLTAGIQFQFFFCPAEFFCLDYLHRKKTFILLHSVLSKEMSI